MYEENYKQIRRENFFEDLFHRNSIAHYCGLRQKKVFYEKYEVERFVIEIINAQISH